MGARGKIRIFFFKNQFFLVKKKDFHVQRRALYFSLCLICVCEINIMYPGKNSNEKMSICLCSSEFVTLKE